MRAGASLVAALCALAGCGDASHHARPVQPRTAASTARLPLSPAAPAPAQSRGRLARPRRGRASSAVIEHGSRRRRLVALTFDADMTPLMRSMLISGKQRSWVDERLFAELERTQTPATIFLTGLWTETYASRVRRMARSRLYELENHSLDHAGWERPCYGLPTVPSAAQKRTEVTATAAIIQRVAGVRPRYFRFPGGCASAADRALVASLGESPVGWDVVSGDPFNANAAAIVRAVLAGVRPGSIIVAHCIGAPNAPATAEAVAQIIPALRARGYRFVTLRELLA